MTDQKQKGFLTTDELFALVGSGVKIENVILTKLDLRHAKISGACFNGVTFDQADLFDADLEGAVFENTVFNRTALVQSHFQKADLIGTVFVNCDCSATDFSHGILSDTVFIADNISVNDPARVTITFEDMGLSPEEIEGLKAHQIYGMTKGEMILKRAVFSGAKMPTALFMEADLEGADLRGVVEYAANRQHHDDARVQE